MNNILGVSIYGVYHHIDCDCDICQEIISKEDEADYMRRLEEDMKEIFSDEI